MAATYFEVSQFGSGSISHARQEDYTLTQLLGAGSFGQVWKATDRVKLKVAIKYMLADDEHGYSQDLLTEIAVPISLDHPNIVQYSAIIGPFNVSRKTENLNARLLLKSVAHPKGLSENQPVIGLVMPAADGDLTDLIEQDLIKNKLANIRSNYVKMAYQLVDAVAYLTSHNIIHRDIKPQNVLYSTCKYGDDYMLYLSDFGLATEGGCYLRPKKSMVYTIMYRPPELLLAGDTDSEYNGKTDVWALGATLYEMYTGILLFRTANFDPYHTLLLIFGMLGKPESGSPMDVAWRRKFMNSEIKPLPNLLLTIKDTNPELYDLLTGMLAIDPENRLDIYQVRSHPLFSNIQVEHPSCYSLVRSDEIECVFRDTIFRRDLNFSALDRGNQNQIRRGRFSITPVDSRKLENIQKLQKWMIDVSMQLKIGDRAIYFMAVQLVLRYVTIQDVPLKELQLVGATALKIADTFISPVGAPLSDFAYLALHKSPDLKAMEIKMMQALNFDLMANTPIDTILGYSHRFNDNIIYLASDILMQVSYNDYFFESVDGRYVYRRNLPETCLAFAVIATSQTMPVLFEPYNINDIDKIIQIVNESIKHIDTPMKRRTKSIGLGLTAITWTKVIHRYRFFMSKQSEVQMGLILADDVDSGVELNADYPATQWFYQKVSSAYDQPRTIISEFDTNVGDAIYDVVIVGKCGDDCLKLVRIGMKALKSGGMMYSESLPRFIFRDHVIGTLDNDEYWDVLMLINENQAQLDMVKSDMLELSIRQRTDDIEPALSVELEQEYETSYAEITADLEAAHEIQQKMIDEEVAKWMDLLKGENLNALEVIAQYLLTYQEDFEFEEEFELSGYYLVLAKV